MEQSRESEMHLEIGAEVTCLFGDAKLRNSTSMTVVSEAPLFLDCSAPEIKRLNLPKTVVLVFQEGDTVLRGEAAILEAEDATEGKTRLRFSKILWENIDRRMYPRLNVSLPVKIRAVYESKEETVISVVDGRTIDLSVGGSKVRVDHPVMKGSLIEFAASLNDQDKVRALGLVVDSDQDGFIRVAFMDYLGATKSKLQEFTRLAAA